MSEIAELFDDAHRAAMDALRQADDSRLGGTVRFFVGPKTMGDVPMQQFLWNVLLDQVHHRGQLSVYLRIVGKVPAIYGPSGDEPWT